MSIDHKLRIGEWTEDIKRLSRAILHGSNDTLIVFDKRHQGRNGRAAESDCVSVYEKKWARAVILMCYSKLHFDGHFDNLNIERIMNYDKHEVFFWKDCNNGFYVCCYYSYQYM